MRTFARPFPLERLSMEARVLYSLFSIFMLVGVGTSFWLAHDSALDDGTAAVARYYRGDNGHEVAFEKAEAIDLKSGGPALALPDDVDTAPMAIEKSARQVVETFHFHAFTMPVCLLIVGHIFMMCGLAFRKKIVVIVLASLSTLLHLCLPPIVRFGGPGVAGVAAGLFAPSAIVMGLTWAIMLVQPLIELWRRPRELAEPAPATTP